MRLIRNQFVNPPAYTVEEQLQRCKVPFIWLAGERPDYATSGIAGRSETLNLNNVFARNGNILLAFLRKHPFEQGLVK